MTIGALAILNDDPTGLAAEVLALTVPNAAANCAQAPSSDGTWSETANYWFVFRCLVLFFSVTYLMTSMWLGTSELPDTFRWLQLCSPQLDRLTNSCHPILVWNCREFITCMFLACKACSHMEIVRPCSSPSFFFFLSLSLSPAISSPVPPLLPPASWPQQICGHSEWNDVLWFPVQCVSSSGVPFVFRSSPDFVRN